MPEIAEKHRKTEPLHVFFLGPGLGHKLDLLARKCRKFILREC